MKNLAQNLLVAAETIDLDSLAPAIVETVLVRGKSQRWVAKYLMENGFKISHASISRRLQNVTKDWTQMLDTVTGVAYHEGKRVDVRWLASTCLAFKTHKGTFWIRTNSLPSVSVLQNEGKRRLGNAEVLGLMDVEFTPKGFSVIPKNLRDAKVV